MTYKQIIIDHNRTHYQTQLKSNTKENAILTTLTKIKIIKDFSKFLIKIEEIDFQALKTLCVLQLERKQKQFFSFLKSLNSFHWIFIGFLTSTSIYHYFSVPNWETPVKSLRIVNFSAWHQKLLNLPQLPIESCIYYDSSRVGITLQDEAISEAGFDKNIDCVLFPGIDSQNFQQIAQKPIPQLKSFSDQREGLFLTYSGLIFVLYTFAIFICLRKTVLKIGTRLALFQSDGIQSQDTDLESVFYETCNHYSPKHLKQELKKDDTQFIENKYWNPDFDTFISLAKLQSRNRFFPSFNKTPTEKQAENFTNYQPKKGLKSAWLQKTLCILFVGPHNVEEDKIILAKTIAHKGNLDFFELDCSAFNTFSVSTALYILKVFFGKVRFSKPCVAYLRNMDSFCQKRDNLFSTQSHGKQLGKKKANFGERENVQFQLLTQFLVDFDGAVQRNTGVLFIASTNNIELLDPALIRSERFAFQYNFVPLMKNERYEFLTAGFKKADIKENLNENEAFELLCSATEGYYRLDLKYVINNVLLNYAYTQILDFSLEKNLLRSTIYTELEKNLIPYGDPNFSKNKHENILFCYIKTGQFLTKQLLAKSINSTNIVETFVNSKWFKFSLLLMNKIVIEDIYFSFSKKFIPLRNRHQTLNLLHQTFYRLSRFDEKRNFLSFFSTLTVIYAPFVSDTEELINIMPEHERKEDFLRMLIANFSTEQFTGSIAYEDVYSPLYLNDKAAFVHNTLDPLEEKISFLHFFTYNFLNSFLRKNSIFEYLATRFKSQNQIFIFDLYKLFVRKKLIAQTTNFDF